LSFYLLVLPPAQVCDATEAEQCCGSRAPKNKIFLNSFFSSVQDITLQLQKLLQ